MKLTTRRYLLPFALITSLFFLWGFARSILDVANQHFRDEMNISIAQSSLIQVTTFIAYFLMAVPAGLFIARYGYRRGVVTGLLLFALGAFLFIPGQQLGTFPAFVACLFIIGIGLAFLETSANPYATELGDPATATSRLNLAQSFNGLGSMLAPALVGGYLFTGGDITLPYAVMGVVVVLVALVFSRVQLPEVTLSSTDASNPENTSASAAQKLSAFFFLGLAALLAYEVAEISINSYFVLFLTGEGYADKIEASQLLSLALGIFMIGRFAGAWLMQHVRPAVVLSACALGSVLCMLAILFGGRLATYALVLNFACESIMFPTIFSLSLSGVEGKAKKRASSLLMMTPVGGCAFLFMGLIADAGSLVIPFIIPLAGFLLVLFFALRATRRKG